MLIALAACTKAPATDAPRSEVRPSILLVTLDTTRADSIGPEAKGVETPAFNALAARGLRFSQAYATTPQTLPSHASMFTGLHPAGHGVHENGRYLKPTHPTLAEVLRSAGYRTAAFVSAFAVARRFGLARGFETYDDFFGEGDAQRGAKETTDRALAYLQELSPKPLFLWVHYYDPHYPYTPPEPFHTRYREQPYLGEVAAMDEQLGRLIAAFEQSVQGPAAIIVAADHGEGLGDHGEAQHGNLLYQATMHVPFVVVGPGVTPGVSNIPISTRRVFHTVLDRAGLDRTLSSGGDESEIVVGEAMKPFLDFGWQPQVMALEGRIKAILSGRLEVYDVIADPGETRDLTSSANLSRAMRAALREYPAPSALAATVNANMSDEEKRKLASLGYVAATARPHVRPDAPRPADMTSLFPILDEASGLFVRERYNEVIPLLRRILTADPHNLDAALRLAVAHSSLGHHRQALEAFHRAQTIAPESRDVRAYLALHYERSPEWQKAIPLLDRVIAEEPERVPALEALARIRERQQRLADALQLRKQIATLKNPSAPELIRTGELAMAVAETKLAIDAFERARRLQQEKFRHDLELGVLYLAAGRLPEARNSLDRVPPSHSDYPMALFKRAQVSVLLREPDSSARIDRARKYADATTRELIARERLFAK